ncbi:MAG: GAF domain-containing protein [Anaerolineae bacterium]|nr:GAF domain-containing protein [Anaerolineae bacterium]
MTDIDKMSQGDILIVDDAPENLKILTQMLVREGYQVRPAINGQLALKAVEQMQPDLILLDIMMPGINGYAVCRQLKANPETCNIPVIFISALQNLTDKVQAFAVGGVDYITKPFQVAEVLARVRAHITLGQLQQQLQEQNRQLHSEIVEREHAESALRESQEELAKAYAREQQRRQLADMLSEVARLVSSTLELEQVLDIILAQLDRVIVYHYANVLLLQDEHLIPVASRNVEGKVNISIKVPKEHYPLNALVLREKRPLWIPDVSQDTRWSPTGTMAKVRSFISTPLLVYDKPIGILTVGRHDTVSYVEDDVETVFAFATQAAIAVHNAQLYTEIRERTERLGLLHNISQAGNITLDLTTILVTACQKIVEHFSCVDHSSIWLFDETFTHTEIAAEYPSQNIIRTPLLLKDEWATQGIIETQRPLTSYDVQNDSLFKDSNAQLKLLGVKSILIVPLISRGQVIGTIGLDAIAQVHQFTQAEVDLAQTLAAQLAAAIQNARLHSAVRQQLNERRRAEKSLAIRESYLAALVEIQRALLSFDSPDFPYVSVLEMLSSVSRASDMYVFENYRDAGGQWFTSLMAQWHSPGTQGKVDAAKLRNLVYADTFPNWFNALIVDRSISGLTADITEPERKFLETQHILSVLVLPLNVGDKFFGFMVFADCKRVHIWSPNETSLLQAAMVAISMARERHQYAQELEIQNEELDAFAHTVAHDLKNPLTSLIGFSSLLERHYERLELERRQEILSNIAQSGRKMTSIIDELLLLASVRKVEEIYTEPLDMAHVVVEALDRLQEMITERHACVETPATWPVVVGYGPWIEEVWANYISNALKYGGRPDEDVVPCIELGYDLKDKSVASCNEIPESEDAHLQSGTTFDWPHGSGASQVTVCFWVRDNGYGLTAEEQENLFTQFTRLHKMRAEGHGLGLSIVRRIVEKLGGEVGVESRPGYGSTFWFTLPGYEQL